MLETKPVAGNEEECLRLIQMHGLKMYRGTEPLTKESLSFPLWLDVSFCLRSGKVVLVSDMALFCRIVPRVKNGIVLVAPFKYHCGIPIFHPFEFTVGQMTSAGVSEAHRFEERMRLNGISGIAIEKTAKSLSWLAKRK